MSILGYVLLDKEFNTIRAIEFTTFKKFFSELGAYGARSVTRISDLFEGFFSRDYIEKLNSVLKSKYPVRFIHFKLNDTHVIILTLTEFLQALENVLSKVRSIKELESEIKNYRIEPCSISCIVTGKRENAYNIVVYEIFVPQDEGIIVKELLNISPPRCKIMKCEPGISANDRIIIDRKVEGWSRLHISITYQPVNKICLDLSMKPVVKYLCRGEELKHSCGTYTLRALCGD